jgi:hypothetical protein
MPQRGKFSGSRSASVVRDPPESVPVILTWSYITIIKCIINPEMQIIQGVFGKLPACWLRLRGTAALLRGARQKDMRDNQK